MWSVNEDDIGTVGSESGTIILDLEHSKGARISLEQETCIAPFAITIGIYGQLMHTIFCSDLEEAQQKVLLLKTLTEKTLNAYELDSRDELNNAIEEIVEL